MKKDNILCMKDTNLDTLESISYDNNSFCYTIKLYSSDGAYFYDISNDEGHGITFTWPNIMTYGELCEFIYDYFEAPIEEEFDLSRN